MVDDDNALSFRALTHAYIHLCVSINILLWQNAVKFKLGLFSCSIIEMTIET